MKRISKNPLDFPLCPLCDNGMTWDERTEVVQSVETGMGAAVALAHSICVENSKEAAPKRKRGAK